MRTFPVLLILFFLVPLIEIFFLVKIGGEIGAWKTIFLVMFTAILGAYLLRQQGLSALGRFQKNMMAGKVPASEMLEGVILLVGGLLLMVPGFFTDAIGFFCLIPKTRRLIARHVVSNPSTAGGFTMNSATHGEVYEGQYTRQRDDRLDHH